MARQGTRVIGKLTTLVLIVSSTVVMASPGVAQALAPRPPCDHSELRNGSKRGSTMTLDKAPPALQRAVRPTLRQHGSPDYGHDSVQLNASDGTIDDEFGDAVALAGSTALVGAPYANDIGVAYVFAKSGSNWSQQAELVDPDPPAFSGLFGCFVALSEDGSIAAVSGDYGTGVGFTDIFSRSGTSWSVEAHLVPPPDPLCEYGGPVSISGSSALLELSCDDPAPSGADVYVRSGSTWAWQATLTDQFGYIKSADALDVAISGDWAALGDPGTHFPPAV